MNYLVIGLARSGISACNMLISKDENVYGYDINVTLGRELQNANILSSKVNVIEKLTKKIIRNINCLVLSPGVPTNNVKKMCKNFNVKIISELELAYQNCLSDILAVTGTDGKTTTIHLLNEIFKQAQKNAVMVGNVGVPFCDEVFKMNKDSVALCEVSSFQLENMETFKPKIASILNIAPDHLNRYKNYNEYAITKMRIFENVNKNDIAILNYDDATIRQLYSNKNCITKYFSLNKLPSNYNGAYYENNNIYIMQDNKVISQIDISSRKLLGGHNIYNILCASLMAFSYGISEQNIQQAINNFVGLPHRIEFVGEKDGLLFYNDSKGTNIHSTLNAINTFSENITLLLGGSDKGEDFSQLFADLPNNVSKIITFGQCGKKIYKYGKKLKFLNILKADKLINAFDLSIKNNNGIVLLSPACASFDEFNNYKERGDYFKSLVKEFINERK